MTMCDLEAGSLSLQKRLLRHRTPASAWGLVQPVLHSSTNLEVRSARVANVDILGMEKCWQHCWVYRRMNQAVAVDWKIVSLFVG